MFDSYNLLSSKEVHHYNTRLSSRHAYAIPNVRTNYGILNIKFAGAKVWNSLDAELKPVPINWDFQGEIEGKALLKLLTELFTQAKRL